AAGRVERRGARGTQRPAARGPAVLRQLGKEDHPHRHLYGRRQVHQRHHPRHTHDPHRRFERRLLDQIAGSRKESEMNRRKFLQTASVAPAAAGVTDFAAPAAGASLTTKIVRLNLKHTWTTPMSSSQYRDTLHTTYT